jgi:hypothetical protein
MKKWSDKLIELSREYLEIDGVNVKSVNAEFGILNIDYENKIYTITFLSSDKTLTFNSVDEIVNSGWAVD